MSYDEWLERKKALECALETASVQDREKLEYEYEQLLSYQDGLYMDEEEGSYEPRSLQKMNKIYGGLDYKANFDCTVYNARKQTLIVKKLDNWRVTRIGADALATPVEYGSFASRAEAERLCEEILRLQSYTKEKK